MLKILKNDKVQRAIFLIKWVAKNPKEAIELLERRATADKLAQFFKTDIKKRDLN